MTGWHITLFIFCVGFARFKSKSVLLLGLPLRYDFTMAKWTYSRFLIALQFYHNRLFNQKIKPVSSHFDHVMLYSHFNLMLQLIPDFSWLPGFLMIRLQTG